MVLSFNTTSSSDGVRANYVIGDKLSLTENSKHACDASRIAVRECAVHLGSAAISLLDGFVSNLPALPPPFNLPGADASHLFGCEAVCERTKFQCEAEVNRCHKDSRKRKEDCKFKAALCAEQVFNCYNECSWMGFS